MKFLKYCPAFYLCKERFAGASLLFLKTGRLAEIQEELMVIKLRFPIVVRRRAWPTTSFTIIFQKMCF